jgi:hypothetical protein
MQQWDLPTLFDQIAFFPLIGIALAMILYMLARNGGWRRWHRRRRGACLNCGYDLRGDFANGCPECGWRREDVAKS